MKLGLLVIAHKYTPALQIMAQEAAARGGEIALLVHVDRKSDLRPFAALPPGSILLDERVDVRWGEFSQVECMLALLRASRREGCDTVQFISGDTILMRPMDEIVRFYAAREGRQFIPMGPLPPRHSSRMKYLYVYPVRPQTAAGRLAQRLRHALRLMRRNPAYDALPQLYFGSNWLGLSGECRDYVLERAESDRAFTDAFRRGRCVDEIFIPTIVAHSPFAAGNIAAPLMLAEFAPGASSPRLIRTEDLPRLAARRDGPYLFARKAADDIDTDQYKRTLMI